MRQAQAQLFACLQARILRLSGSMFFVLFPTVASPHSSRREDRKSLGLFWPTQAYHNIVLNNSVCHDDQQTICTAWHTNTKLLLYIDG